MMDGREAIKAQRRGESAQVVARLREVLPAILARYPVDAAYVYGSVARGAMLPSSDVDIALLLAEPPPPYERLQMEVAIQAEVDDAGGLPPADVRAINHAPLLVRGRVLKEGILLYEGHRARRVAFEVITRKRYFDFEPAARRINEAFLERVRREGLLYGRS